MKLPRFMIAAPASGSGKTLVTCGLLQAFVNRGIKTASFKCGPDYIDPMFHTKVIGVPSRNLDTFFVSGDTVRYLFGRQAMNAHLSVMEGVMGFYDGAAGITREASSWELADETDTPVILVVNARGMSLSVIPLIRGFLTFYPDPADSGGERNPYDSHIRGVILNQVSASIYPELKQKIEEFLPVRVYGYVPKAGDCVIGSRHLGLVTPGEIHGFQDKLQRLAHLFETTVDIDGILELADGAADLNVRMPESLRSLKPVCPAAEKLRIAVARDESFCFYYEDNLELLREAGAELVPFSPLHDAYLPEGIRGLLLGGGYPELYAGRLSENTEMLRQIRSAIQKNMPYLAECGGFMYLHAEMEDVDGRSWPMADVFPGRVRKTDRLSRFGYIQLCANRSQIFGDAGCCIRAHEFHYFDSTDNGDAFHAEKPYRNRGWECMNADENHAAGFPHLYYYSNPEFAERFVRCCAESAYHKDISTA
ncbi:MAG: cobyrinate a,c-diamide synthase [Lachnospiraceae bacterium]|nr:cobyrinate a,c-diamide synthase [Lachnospiraceae bacterium]